MEKDLSVKIVCDDCFNFLKNLKQSEIDAVVVDLPYYGVVKEEFDNQWNTEYDYLLWVKQNIEESTRALKDGGAFVLFCSRQLVHKIALICESFGLVEQRMIIWCRKRCFNQTRGKALNSIVPAKTKFSLPIDGLSKEWNYKTIFVNPPYGNDKERKTSIKDWICKCYKSHKEYGSEILALIPVATNTRHWKEYIFGKASICFLFDTRLKFMINGSIDNKGATMACAMVYWGNNKDKFSEIFSEYGYVCT